MPQPLFDAVSASRRLRDAGFAAEQAEAVVHTVTQANSLTLQMVQDLADLKAYVTANMVTRDDIKDMATKDDIRNMATRDDIKDMVTRDDIKDMVTRDDIKDMVTRATLDRKIDGLVTRAELQEEFKRLYRNLLFGSLGCVSLIIAAMGVATAAAVALL